MSISNDSPESSKRFSGPSLEGRRVLVPLILGSGVPGVENWDPSTGRIQNFELDSSESTDSTTLEDDTNSTQTTVEWELEVSHLDRETFKLLTGHYPEDPVPKPRFTFEFDGHTIEASFDTEVYHPDRRLKHEYQFTDVVWLCGPHDEEGNHIE